MEQMGVWEKNKARCVVRLGNAELGAAYGNEVARVYTSTRHHHITFEQRPKGS